MPGPARGGPVGDGRVYQSVRTVLAAFAVPGARPPASGPPLSSSRGAVAPATYARADYAPGPSGTALAAALPDPDGAVP